MTHFEPKWVKFGPYFWPAPAAQNDPKMGHFGSFWPKNGSNGSFWGQNDPFYPIFWVKMTHFWAILSQKWGKMTHFWPGPGPGSDLTKMDHLGPFWPKVRPFLIIFDLFDHIEQKAPKASKKALLQDLLTKKILFFSKKRSFWPKRPFFWPKGLKRSWSRVVWILFGQNNKNLWFLLFWSKRPKKPYFRTFSKEKKFKQ